MTGFASLLMWVFLYRPSDSLALIKRNKIARITPSATNTFTDHSSLTKKAKKQGTGKGKKGSLDVQGLLSLGLSQVSTLNVSFFEDDTSNIIFTWTDTMLNHSTVDEESTSWYGEALNGIGSITIIQPHSSRIAG